MPVRIQTLRSSVKGQRPTAGSREVGELYVNYPDRTVGVIDAGKNPLDLLAIRFFSVNADYVGGDFVVNGGVAYKAKGPVAAGAFNAGQWDQLATATDLALRAPLASPVFTGDPQAPTPTAGDNDTSIATTAFVATALTAGGAVPAAQLRNRIVNPAMSVSQENGNAAGTANSYYATDQWQTIYIKSVGTITSQRVQLATPNGSRDRYRVTITLQDASLAAGELLNVCQFIEGLRLADFGWGAAGARQVVLRFGWKSPAGTFSIAIQNGAVNRSYVQVFTISAGQANTDTAQTFVIPGDTTGAWAIDNTAGMTVMFGIASGSTYQGTAGSWQANDKRGTAACTNGMAPTGAIYEIFDVGLYLDPAATGLPPVWSAPDYATELQTCMRYYQPLVMDMIGTAAGAGSYFGAQIIYSPPMRAAPVVTTNTDGTLSNAASAAFDDNYPFTCRAIMTSTAAGSFGAAYRTGKAVARM